MGTAVPRRRVELILLGVTEAILPARSALRKVGCSSCDATDG